MTLVRMDPAGVARFGHVNGAHAHRVRILEPYTVYFVNKQLTRHGSSVAKL